MEIYTGPKVTHPEAAGFELVGYDAMTKERVWARWHDPSDENNMGCDIVYDIDAKELMNQNHEAVMESMGKRLGNWNRIGSVPHEIARAAGLDDALKQKDRKWIHKWFRDSDNRGFRTSSKI